MSPIVRSITHDLGTLVEEEQLTNDQYIAVMHVCALDRIADQLKLLGTNGAITEYGAEPGAIEFLGMQISRIADTMED